MKINVLSLFDGCSCGQLALQRAWIEYENYYASEIDKYAIKVTHANFPNTIQLGDVRNVHAKDLPKIDLLIGGSPCQGFSFAGKGLNFEDVRSNLFFEYVRILNELRAINSNIKFLLENVRMKYEHELVISKYMGIEPIMINSALLSAQNRVRLYWTNINEVSFGLFGDKKPNIQQPKDKGILLRDILEKEVNEKYYISNTALKRIERKEYSQPQINPEKAGTINTKNNSGQLSIDSGTALITKEDFKGLDLNGKGKTLRTSSRSSQSDKHNFDLITPEKSYCIDANYHKGTTVENYLDKKRRQLVQVASDMDLIVHNMQPRSGDPLKGGGQGAKTGLYNDCGIRRLTPIECERLQTVEDGLHEPCQRFTEI